MKTRYLNPFFVYAKRKYILPEIKSWYRQRTDRVFSALASGGTFLRSIEKRLAGFQNSASQKACFIVGNGPSLRIKDLNSIHQIQVPSFAFNRIYLSFEDTAFRPTFYMVEDPLVSLKYRDEIQALKGQMKFFPTTFEDRFERNDATYFYPIDWRDWFPKKPAMTPNPFPIQWGASVTSSAIQMAIFMGFREIYLIGIDFSFTEPVEKDSQDPTKLISVGEQNHFHPEYRRAGEVWYAPRLEHQKLAFEVLDEISKRLRVRIVNATRGGRLEVFERADLDTILMELQREKPQQA